MATASRVVVDATDGTDEVIEDSKATPMTPPIDTAEEEDSKATPMETDSDNKTVPTETDKATPMEISSDETDKATPMESSSDDKTVPTETGKATPMESSSDDKMDEVTPVEAGPVEEKAAPSRVEADMDMKEKQNPVEIASRLPRDMDTRIGEAEKLYAVLTLEKSLGILAAILPQELTVSG